MTVAGAVAAVSGEAVVEVFVLEDFGVQIVALVIFALAVVDLVVDGPVAGVLVRG